MQVDNSSSFYMVNVSLSNWRDEEDVFVFYLFHLFTPEMKKYLISISIKRCSLIVEEIYSE